MEKSYNRCANSGDTTQKCCANFSSKAPKTSCCNEIQAFNGNAHKSPCLVIILSIASRPANYCTPYAQSNLSNFIIATSEKIYIQIWREDMIPEQLYFHLRVSKMDVKRAVDVKIENP